MGAVVNKTWLSINILSVTITLTPEANEIGQTAQVAGKLAAGAFDTAWKELAGGKSHIWEATVKVSLGFAAILIAFWAIPFFNTIINDGFLSAKTISELLWPIAVILMLAVNNGALLSSTCLFFRSSANYINNQILEETINGIRIEQAIRKTHMSQAFQEMLSNKVQQCNSLPNDRQENGQNNNQGQQLNNQEARMACIKSAFTEVQKIAKEQEKGFKTPSFEDVFNGLGNIVNKSAEAVAQITIRDPIQKVLFLIFTTFQMGFVFLIEIASLLNAYIAPIFLALSLLPGQSKLLHVWLSGWLGLGLVKVSYTLIIGMATTSVANAQGIDPLLLPLLEGVLSPILALAIASGGGMALFNGLTSAVAGSVRFVTSVAAAFLV